MPAGRDQVAGLLVAGVEKTVLGDAGDLAVRQLLWLFGLQRLWLLHEVNIGRFHPDPGDDRHDLRSVRRSYLGGHLGVCHP